MSPITDLQYLTNTTVLRIVDLSTNSPAIISATPMNMWSVLAAAGQTDAGTLSATMLITSLPAPESAIPGAVAVDAAGPATAADAIAAVAIRDAVPVSTAVASIA